MRAWMMILASLAGLFGAAGVALAAAGAHITGEGILRTAADFLLFHAAALFALLAIARGAPTPRGMLAAATLIALGTLLFSGDIALLSLAHVHPIPMAAPIGGILLILGWIASAITAPLALGL